MKRRHFLGSIAGLSVLWASRGFGEQQGSVISPKVWEETIRAKGGRVDFVFGDDRPFKSCHASTLAAAGDGTLLCAWFGGKEEKDPDVAIWLSRFTAGAWGAPVKVAKINETAHWNPVLFCPEGKEIYLFFKAGPEIETWQTYWTQSVDNGVSWSAPVELVAGDHGGRGPVRNKPIKLQDGAWLAGASTELKGWRAFADRSEDQGKTWTRSADFEIEPAVLHGRGAIQPTLWEFAPGKVRALLRSQSGRVWSTTSEDGGRTWTKVATTLLPNNNSGVDAAPTRDGKVWLVYNPVGKNWGARSPLSIAHADIAGDTWQRLCDLEDEPMKEFSYPAILALPDGGMAISYTWKRERVRVWQIPPGAVHP